MRCVLSWLRSHDRGEVAIGFALVAAILAITAVVIVKPTAGPSDEHLARGLRFLAVAAGAV